MRNDDRATLSRRGFLERTAAITGGLVVGFHVGGGRLARAAAAPGFVPNAFVTVAESGAVTVYVNHSEMGQGVHTALPMIVAEELDADWSDVVVRQAPARPEYVHAEFGMYVTGGSSSVRSSWQRLREAGATARAALLQAAARRWRVEPESLTTDPGVVVHASSGRRASYGELVAHTSGLRVPEKVPLKPRAEWRYLGKNMPRYEGPDKVTGRAEFGIDVEREGMLTALIARPPVCGNTVKDFDGAKALTVPGVVKVKAVTAGVAVIARDFWSAKRGRDALAVTWADGPNVGISTEALRKRYLRLSKRSGTVAETVGDVSKALEGAARRIDAVYEVPYLAHAPMEPLNCTAHVRADGCDIWTGTQFQSNDQMLAAAITGLSPEQVEIHTTMLGGGFGRRATPDSDFVRDAVEVAKGEPVPVKTVWTREDDIRCGYYRPMFLHRLEAGLDAAGNVTAWKQRLVGQSILSGTAYEQFLVKDGIDLVSVEGAVDSPYAVPNRRVELHSPPVQLPVLWWRSVGHTHTAFANECFLDECARAAGRDPFEMRRDLLAGAPRHRRVLEVAAEKAGWGGALPEGRARGIAMRESFSSFAAQVAEVSVESGRPKVHRIVCAIDCGIALNPWNVVAQVESAIVYGLTAVLYGELTLEKGQVQQSNFHDYPVLRMNEMPVIEVHVVESDEPPTGVGEPGTPPVAPAVANALLALTGKPVRRLPIKL